MKTTGSQLKDDFFLYGNPPTKDSISAQLIESLGGRFTFIDESFAHDASRELPSMVIFSGEASEVDTVESSDLDSDIEQIQISNWLDTCLQLDQDPKNTPYFIALCEYMSFDNQVKATRLREFSFIQPSLGYFQCLSSLTRCRTCQRINKINQNILNIIVIDDVLPIFESPNSNIKIPEINLVQIDDISELIKGGDELNIDLIVVNVSRKNIDLVSVIKLINRNLKLATKPLILYGNHEAQELIINHQLSYTRMLITPFSTTEFCLAVCQSLIESKRSAEINNYLELSHQAQIHLEKTIDSHALISKTDSQGVITYANEKFCEISQYNLSELLGETHSIINSGYHNKLFFGDMWETISAGNIWQGLVCNRKKDGSLYWVNSTICPLPIQQNSSCINRQQKYNYLSIRTEITDTMLNKERLSKGQSFANIGTWDWNINTGEVYWSERVGHLFGYGENVPVTKYEAFFNSVHPDDKELVNQALDKCINEGKSYQVEHRILTPGGEIRWLSEKGDVVRDNYGKPSHLMGVVQDITFSKLSEIKMKVAIETAEKNSLAKSKFLASMSHELRTPMNAILGFTQLLEMDKESPLTHRQTENLLEISNASEHLLNLIDQLLNMSEIESGKINLSIGKVDIALVISECLSMLHPIIKKMKINFELSYMENFIEKDELAELKLFVRADLVRLKQIFINLLSNACKYNDVGGLVKIVLAIEGEQIRVGIIDTGKGMSQEDQTRVFEPFERLGAEQSDIEGTGIGLVITRQLVELMGGDLNFNSQIGQGSEFYFTIPIDERRLSGRDASSTLLVDDKREDEKETVQENRKKILYVEDNPTNLRLVSQLIGRIPNTELFSAHNAEIGIELARKNIPDLILMDINLPGMSGIEALEVLKKTHEIQNVPVLAVSANAMADDIEKALSAGFENYITKPINVIELTKNIKDFLAV